MNESTALSIFTWLGEHPVLFGLFIFLIALTESLAVVGVLVPGVIFMLVIGAYLATDQFSFLYAVILTFAGAVTGDAISYYLGYRYKNKLASVWPLSRYPKTFEKGIHFFKRHGVKSVILGRFIGPIRPMVPAIAGMFQMPQKLFFISNVTSALIWAPAILLPGYIIGLSMEYASDITARLITLIIIFGILLWIIFWLIKTTYLFLLPQFDNFISVILSWSQKHPITGKIPSILLEKHYSDKKVFLLLTFLYVIFSFVFFIIPESYDLFGAETNIDLFLNNLFLKLNSPSSNHFIVKILNLLDFYWILTLSISIFILILWKKNTTLLRYYLFSIISTGMLQIILNTYLPIDQNYNLFAVNIYLFLTFMLTFNSSTRRKIVYYGICYALITAILLAQLYQNSADIIQLAIINLFSIFWIIILTSTYRHHCTTNQITHQFQRKTGLFFLALLFANIIFLPASFKFNPEKPNIFIIEKNNWINNVSLILPAHRKGFINTKKHPFNIQWVDSKEDIIKTFSNKSKWMFSRSPTISETLQFLNPQADINSLAIFSHLHNGAYEQMRFTKTYENKKGQKEILVIRLWKSNFKVKDLKSEKKSKQLWLGTLTKLIIVKRLGFQLLQTKLLNKNQFQKFGSSFKQSGTKKLLRHKNEISILLLSSKNQ
ncbi:MAG: DedA family protein [Gammaproteobacteria bacterium]